jgi:UDP-glucose 4-epimerase
MLEHLKSPPEMPTRTVILGAGGFVGGASLSAIADSGANILGLARADLDLLDENAAETLTDFLKPEDALVIVSARVPCKDNEMLTDNLHMMHAICTALKSSPVSHIVYISSDAVYGDETKPLTEESATKPGAMHGIMHITREEMLSETIGDTPYAILRPTLLYGAADPHNGYGPNRFRRLAAAGDDIELFGEGEERRDHVLIDDVARLVCLVLAHRSVGTLNIATGDVTSFRDAAEMVVGHFDPPVAITGTPRSDPMPHNGYRPFDPAATGKAFPEFQYTSITEGIRITHQQAAGTE